MAADHPENEESKSGHKGLDAETREAAPLVTCDLSNVPGEPSSPPQSDEPRRVVKRPPIGSLAEFRASELYKSQFSAAEQMRKMLGGSLAEQMQKASGESAAEQMRKAMGGSAAEQIRKAMGGTLADQMRQIEQSLRPVNTLHETVGRLARSMVESPMRQFLDEQASRHRQMMELMRPRWDQTLVGNALSDSFRAVQSFNSFHQTEAFRAQDALRQQLNSVSDLLEALRPRLPSFDQLSEFWLEYPARVKENLVALAEAGWYLDPDMPARALVHFKEDLETRTAEEVNDELVHHFRSALDRIEASLCAQHPKRAHLIKEAFDAHRRGQYSLSIVALFAQADGICLDLTGYQFFSGRGFIAFVKRIDAETLERAYLEPLLRKMPIGETSRQRREKIPQLNRHAVMHGESTDFPSEANGLKAISFIHFVSHVLGMAVAWRNEMASISQEKEPPEIIH